MADRAASAPPLAVEELCALVSSGEIDTVVLAFTDMQGRLQASGSPRPSSSTTCWTRAPRAATSCSRRTSSSTPSTASGERGYGGFARHGDPGTLRRVPWNPGTALLLADLAHHDGTPAPASPRQVLKRLAAHGWSTLAAPNWSSSSSTTPTRTAGAAATENSPPPTGTTPTTRSSAPAASSRSCGASATRWRRHGRRVGERDLGRQEIVFRYTGALTTCDPTTRRAPRRSRRGRTGRSPSPSRSVANRAPPSSPTVPRRAACPPRCGTSSPDGSPRCTSPPSPTRRTASPTSASGPAASHRPPSPGARATAPAPYASWTTAPATARAACSRSPGGSVCSSRARASAAARSAQGPSTRRC